VLEVLVSGLLDSLELIKRVGLKRWAQDPACHSTASEPPGEQAQIPEQHDSYLT
jgi:hypothetical protein